MGFGGQSRGLIQASKTQGWDPTRIYDCEKHAYGEDISQFDRDPKDTPGWPHAPRFVGEIPGGTPSAWPDQPATPQVGSPDAALDAALATQQQAPFATPDAGRETAVRHTTNADPFPAMPGAR